jgi:hypothetical protein
MTDEPLEPPCTCRITGKCEVCRRWHVKLTEILQRSRIDDGK